MQRVSHTSLRCGERHAAAAEAAEREVCMIQSPPNCIRASQSPPFPARLGRAGARMHEQYHLAEPWHVSANDANPSTCAAVAKVRQLAVRTRTCNLRATRVACCQRVLLTACSTRCN
jgi:hypothetical protein